MDGTINVGRCYLAVKQTDSEISSSKPGAVMVWL